MSLIDKQKTAQANGDNVVTHMFYKEDVKETVKRVKERYVKICEIEGLDKKWVIAPIDEEFGEELT